MLAYWKVASLPVPIWDDHAETIWSSLLDVTKNLTINKLWNRSFNQDHSAPWLFQGEWFLMDFQLSGIGGRMLKPLHIRSLKKHRNSANNALSQSIDWWCATISSSPPTSETLFIPLHWRALGSYCNGTYSESWSWLVLTCHENYVKWRNVCQKKESVVNCEPLSEIVTIMCVFWSMCHLCLLLRPKFGLLLFKLMMCFIIASYVPLNFPYVFLSDHKYIYLFLFL